MKNKIIEKIERNKDKIREKGVKKIGIFGSAIKGKRNPSDIDVLVEFQNINSDNFFDLLFFLQKLFRKKIDLVIESDLKPELKYVKKEAKYVKI
ncbi:MAG: nucleotidyltransferase family protein [Nanoarchaeota archaeon]